MVATQYYGQSPYEDTLFESSFWDTLEVRYITRLYVLEVPNPLCDVHHLLTVTHIFMSEDIEIPIYRPCAQFILCNIGRTTS